MKVVIAIDSFKGSLSSLQAGTAAATGIYRVDPKVETVVRPLADGGEDSPNYIIVLLLSWVTCGIYGVYWRYKQANRMYRESYDRYGVMIEENGSAILLWTLLGYLTGGIGQLVADYFMIQNLNKTALVYNSRAY